MISKYCLLIYCISFQHYHSSTKRVLHGDFAERPPLEKDRIFGLYKVFNKTMPEVWESLENLVNAVKEEKSIQNVQNCKLMLSRTHPQELKKVIKPDHVVPFFDCLSEDDLELVKITVSLIQNALELLEPEVVIKALARNLELILHSTKVEVKSLGLQEVFRWCSSNDTIGLEIVTNFKDLILLVIDCLADDLSIAANSIKILSEIGTRSVNASQTLMSNTFVQHFYKIMKTSDEVRYRVYDIIIKISSTSPEHLDVCTPCGILDECIKEIKNNDVLCRVTSLSAVNDIASTPHGFRYLYSCGALAELTPMIKKANEEPLGHLYLPQLIKFFGYMASNYGVDKVLEIHNDFIKDIFQIIEESDVTMKQIAIETFGLIAKQSKGKLFLDKQNGCSNCVREISQSMHQGDNVYRVSAIASLTNMLHVANPLDNIEACDVALKWFQLISNSPIDKVLELCRQPFMDIRCSSLYLLNKICKQPWGVRIVVEHPGFVEYILDRNTEMEKESKERKYEIVKTLVETEECMHIFGNNNYLKFRQFVNEGPFFVNAVSQVAVEEG